MIRIHVMSNPKVKVALVFVGIVFLLSNHQGEVNIHKFLTNIWRDHHFILLLMIFDTIYPRGCRCVYFKMANYFLCISIATLWNTLCYINRFVLLKWANNWVGFLQKNYQFVRKEFFCKGGSSTGAPGARAPVWIFFSLILLLLTI